jgi:hypothetical protein
MISTVIIASSCNKDDADTSTYTATVNVINAIASPESEIKMNFTSEKIIYADAKNLNYFYFDGKFTNGALTFGVPAGDVPLTVTLAKDTIKPFYTSTLTLKPLDIYSLFLTGDINSPTGLLVKDTIQFYQDSVSGVRFVNLSPNSGAISINVSGNPIGSEVAALDYKGITPFIKYPAKSNNENYFFEIHDATTGDFLTGFFYNDVARFKNVTLVIRGVVWGDPGLEVVRIDYY